MAEVGYRLGTGSTEEMLQTWQLRDELQRQLWFAEADVEKRLSSLSVLLFPVVAMKQTHPRWAGHQLR